MPQFSEHIAQATRNLHFLEAINAQCPSYVDWQVTACFYTAVHLVNAHLSNYGFQFRTHLDVNHALNPEHALSVSRIDEPAYLAYIKLTNLSRRARYLVSENPQNRDLPNAQFTYSKHAAKAIRQLNALMEYFARRYRLELPRVRIQSPDLQEQENLTYFQKVT